MRYESTQSDITIFIVQWVEGTLRKLAAGEQVFASDAVNPAEVETLIKCKVGLACCSDVFEARYNGPTGAGVNAYETITNVTYTDKEGKQNIIAGVPCIGVTIPRGTFNENGRLRVSVANIRPDEHYPNERHTTTNYKDTEVQYVKQC